MNHINSHYHQRLSNKGLLLCIFALSIWGISCDLDNGKGISIPQDPVHIIDPSTVDVSVFVDPPNVPADGESHSTIHARIKINGQPAQRVPVLFYSEWGTVFTACATPQGVSIGDFADGIVTGINGEASTLIQAPVLPNLFKNEQESNTVAAFFLVDGSIFTAINNQNVWQVDLSTVKCNLENSRVRIRATFAGRGIYPVSACNSVRWQANSSNISVTEDTLCTNEGHSSATVEFNSGSTKGTVEIVANFSGFGPNECILDVTRNLAVIGYVTIDKSSGSAKCTVTN